MGRQEQPLDPGQGPLARFACDLRELRRRAGSPPYRELAARTHYSASTLAAAAAGHRLPGPAVLAAFVRACGGDPDDWERRRVRTHELVTGRPSDPDPVLDPAVDPALAPAQDPAAPPDPSPAVSSAVRGRTRRAAAPHRSTGLTAVMAVVLAFAALVHGDAPAPVSGSGTDRPQEAAFAVAGLRLQGDARWLRTDTDIPKRYRSLIVQAGTLCGVPQITPALIAAMLQAESGFDPELNDPDKDEYGIARWTPRVLRYYLPPDRQGAVPVPPLTPEDSIPALGRMLCAIAPELEGVPGDPALNLAAAYRTATWTVRQQDPGLRRIQPYLDQVHSNLLRYRPASGSGSGSGSGSSPAPADPVPRSLPGLQ